MTERTSRLKTEDFFKHLYPSRNCARWRKEGYETAISGNTPPDKNGWSETRHFYFTQGYLEGIEEIKAKRRRE